MQIRLSRELEARLSRIARETGRTKSELTRQWIDEGCREYERREETMYER